MKIINGKQLGYMPNGTVFSDIVDKHFDPYGPNGDMSINGINIMCGHDCDWFPTDSGKFNGIMHMINYVPCSGTDVNTHNDENGVDEFYWDILIDTDHNDYTENDWVVVYEKAEVEKIIENLQWALNGCPGC